MLDAFQLARIQFAANITFHILFPAVTIALCWFLLFFKLAYIRTGEEKWMDCYKFWVKVFALCFALGVVSGITMSFQFGTNWPGFMKKVGNIAGPLLGYEVLSAFFLEATFLGVMLFGTNKVPEWLHNLSIFLVAIGTSLSAFWIIALNSWMQHPVGYKVIDGVLHADSWMEIIFNPTMPYMLTHVLLSSGLTASFMIAGVSSLIYLKSYKSPFAIPSIKAGVYVAAILIPIQIFVGDLHGLHTKKVQPAKIAAMEAVWETQKGAPLVLFAIPNEKEKRNDFEISIPYGASLILTHSLDGEIKGLNEFEGKQPPVAPVFWSFRIMVGVGILMLIFSWIATFDIYRKGKPSKLIAKILVFMTFSGWVAVVSGWYVTEIGRQPYLVYDVLKTIDAKSDVAPQLIATSLTMYLAVYVVLILSFMSTLFYMAKNQAKIYENRDEKLQKNL